MAEYPVTKAGVGAAPHRLHDALLAASIPVRTVRGDGANQATVVSDTVGLEAQIATLLATFNPATETPSEQQQDADVLSLQALRDQYQTLKAGLDTIRTHQATIQSTPNPTTANLAALVGVANAVKQVSADVTTMTTGLDRLLDTLAVFVRRQS